MHPEEREEKFENEIPDCAEIYNWALELLPNLLKRIEFVLVQYYVTASSKVSESSNFKLKSDKLKLYMHCLYEIKIAFQVNILDIQGDVNMEGGEMMQIFSQRHQDNSGGLELIYWVRSHLSAVFNRPYESGYWAIERIKIIAKESNKYFEVLNLFEEIQPIKDFIFSYDLEQARYSAKNQEWSSAVLKLENHRDEIVRRMETRLEDDYGEDISLDPKILRPNLEYEIDEFICETFAENNVHQNAIEK